MLLSVYIKNDLFSYARKFLKTITPKIIVRVFKNSRASESVKCHLKIKNNNHLQDIASSVSKFLRNHPESPDVQYLITIFNNNGLCALNLIDVYFLLLDKRLYEDAIRIRRYIIFKYINDFDFRRELYLIKGECIHHSVLMEAYYYDLYDVNKSGLISKLKEVHAIDSRYNILNKLVHQKRVCILGPFSSDLNDLQSLIDENDVCILPNFLSGYEKYDFSNVVTISFYNEYHAKRLFIEPSLRPSMKATYHIFRSLKYYYQYRLLKEGKCGFVESCQNFISGKNMGVQSIIREVIKYNPISMKLVGATLFASQNLYPDHYNTVKDDIYHALVRHDPLANFLYVKFLYDFNILEAEEITATVLRLSPQQYLKTIVNTVK